MKRGKVTTLVGAQYGSEGKGVIAHHLADRFPVHVRTGGPNAGHTIKHEGRVWKMQTVPCGWTNPEAKLVIGAGALIDLKILAREVLEIEEAGYSVRDRIFVDSKAGVINNNHRGIEGGTAGEMHKKIGSTGEGVGIARMARIARRVSGFAPLDTFDQFEQVFHNGRDTVKLLDDALSTGRDVLLEGTQGSALSLVHGPWPFVTSHDTNAAQLFADAGLSPRDCGDVILVARTHPIRVAGNSGPLLGETSFETLGVPEERTTVTKKVRRIGAWDPGLLRRAIMLNRPTQLALTFLDYVFPEVAGETEGRDLSDEAIDYLQALEDDFGVTVRFAGTGGDNLGVIDL